MAPRSLLRFTSIVTASFVFGVGIFLFGTDSSSHVNALVYFLLGVLLVPCAKHLLSESNRRAQKKSLYNLEHARLNMALPPQCSMWMNMGYWKNTHEFPKACQALLVEVLATAGLKDIGTNNPSRKRKVLLDLGIGCGDQTLFLTSTSYPELIKHSSQISKFSTYIGITINQDQHDYARNLFSSSTVGRPEVHLFCADAANPDTWSPELANELLKLSSANEDERWVLALDTLYHFAPSRGPILRYACTTLDASVMAFDLLLAGNTSVLTRLSLSLVAVMMGAPYDTFKTSHEYQSMLIDAGYVSHHIELRDISEHVFAPLSAFLSQREKELKRVGWGLGRLRAAKWIFEWWAKTGIIRGIIVVARK